MKVGEREEYPELRCHRLRDREQKKKIGYAVERRAKPHEIKAPPSLGK
jgi:hypothetical protein